MTRRLPILFLLSVICYLLSTVPSFAQEITPTIISASQINPQAQGTDFENFMKNLIPEQFRQIPSSLEKVNSAYLPLEAVEGIKNENILRDQLQSGVKPQANSSESQQDIVRGAYQYDVRSGISLPSDVARSSTNVDDVFGGIIDFIKNITKIFDQGSQKAQWSATKDLPAEVGEKVLTKQSAMNDALSISQCGELSPDLCHDNKLNTINSSRP